MYLKWPIKQKRYWKIVYQKFSTYIGKVGNCLWTPSTVNLQSDVKSTEESARNLNTPLNQDFVLKMIKLSFSNHVRVIYDADLPSYRPAEALRKVSYLPTLSILSNWWGDFTHKIVKIPLMKTGIQPSCSNADKTWNAKYFLVKWETVLKKFRAGHKTASF